MPKKSTLRVLEATSPPGTTTKYIDQVVRFAPGDIEFSYFSWPRAILARYHVFHVHWPEFLLRADTSFSAVIKRFLFRLFLLRLRVGRVRIVRTLHNLAPHSESASSDQMLLAALDRVTSEWVTLSSCGELPVEAPRTVIRHGDYRVVFEGSPRHAAAQDRFLFFGRIHPYKGVLALIEAFENGARPGSDLRIVGSPTPELRVSIAARVAAVARRDVSVSFDFDFVSDERMVEEITSATAVVLPYSEMYNSGVALVALSLDRPIIVPRSCVNTELAYEAGPGWVIQYDGDLDGETWVDIAATLDDGRSSQPRLDNRTWKSIASNYASVFRGTSARR